MISDGYRRIAIRVLAKVKAYDPRTSTDAPQVEAWAEHLECQRLSNLDELLSAVRDHFLTPRPYPTQPADISRLVQESKRDPYALDSTQPPRHVPLPPGPTASEEHRRKCMAEITETLGKRWSVSL